MKRVFLRHLSITLWHSTLHPHHKSMFKFSVLVSVFIWSKFVSRMWEIDWWWALVWVFSNNNSKFCTLTPSVHSRRFVSLKFVFVAMFRTCCPVLIPNLILYEFVWYFLWQSPVWTGDDYRRQIDVAVFACIFIVGSNECVSLTISRGSSSVLRVIARAAVAVTHAIQMILISRLVLWDPSAVIILTGPHVIGAVIKASAT